MRRLFLIPPCGCLALLLAAAAPAAPTPTDDGALVAAIRKVGRKGAGNVEAAKAWKALVARGPAAMAAALRGMSDDDPTASNWLRAAVDAIGEKALAGGKALPKDDLEKVVADKKNSAVGRRLAYEWLVKADKTAPDRLLPKMLLDPSPELRRDAVARALAEAKALLDDGNKGGAAEGYKRALSGASDRDQVDEAAKQLKALGVAVDLQAHFGLVKTWQLVAGFDNTGGKGFAAAYAPEKKVDLGAGYKDKEGKETRWKEFSTADPYGVVDLKKLLGPQKGSVAYAYAVVESPAARPVQVRVGSPNAVKVFLNGKEVLAREEYHHGMKMDQYVAKVALKKGANELLIKVCQNEQKESWAQNWMFQARLADAAGVAVPWTLGKPAKEDKP